MTTNLAAYNDPVTSWSPLNLGVLLQVHVLFSRTHFLTDEELMAVNSSEANSTDTDFPCLRLLDPLLRAHLIPAQDNLPFD